MVIYQKSVSIYGKFCISGYLPDMSQNIIFILENV